MTDTILPDGFGDLAPWLADWALPSTSARSAQRSASAMADIQRFYDAMAPRLAAALTHLDQIPYAPGMAPADRNLLDLCLSLAEVTPAVEWYRQPGVVDGYDPAAIRMNAELP